ncbi:MAG: EamA family transporter [bacterium]|jgi:drug/metabolite transporter (DMT)-like permease
MTKWLLVALIIGCNSCGDLCNTLGMRRYGEVHDFHPRALGRMARALSRNTYIVAGIAAMAVAFFALVSLLSIAPLSFAVPATAATYVIEALLAKMVLKEHVHWRRWAGVSLVAFGVVLLAF